MTLPDLEPAALEAAIAAFHDPNTTTPLVTTLKAYLAAARSAPEAGKAVDETALMAEMLTALKQSAAQFSQYTEHRRLTADEQFAFDSARLAIAKFEANR